MATNNIEKLYELANIDKKLDCQRCGAKELKSGKCFDVDCESTYPPFTNTKQLELIKLLSCSNDFFLDINGEKPKFTDVFLWTISVEWYSDSKSYKNIQKDFSQALAGLVCELWEDLTPEQREEVRGILE